MIPELYQIYYASFLLFGVSILIFLYLIGVRLIKLYAEKRRQKFIQNIQDELISILFSGEDVFSETSNLAILKLKDKISENSSRKKHFINLLLELSKSLDGEVRGALGYIYLKCDLLPFSERILFQGSWVEKAITIQVLSQLHIDSAFEFISLFTNDKNILIRREAQIAAVRLGGANCLKFIDDLEVSLSVWQQLRILEELKHQEKTIIPNYKVWFLSKNESVVHFALKLIAEFGHLEALVHFKYIFTTDSIQLRKRLLDTIRKLQIPFFNDEFLRWKNVHDLRLDVIKTLTVTNDNKQKEILPFLESDEYNIFKQALLFFKKNNNAMLDEFLVTHTLTDNQQKILKQVNDPRI